jgi:hypothetical protein
MLSLGMTALPAKADIDRRARHVRFVPLATKPSAAKLCLFHHFVGDCLQHQTHGEMSPLRRSSRQRPRSLSTHSDAVSR